MSNIKVGDLVMVVRGNGCCPPKTLGRTFTISEFSQTQIITCFGCGKVIGRHLLMAHMAGDSMRGFELSRLIKIDPPSLPESIEHEKELSV